jgi:hypothetical protein
MECRNARERPAHSGDATHHMAQRLINSIRSPTRKQVRFIAGGARAYLGSQHELLMGPGLSPNGPPRAARVMRNLWSSRSPNVGKFPAYKTIH